VSVLRFTLRICFSSNGAVCRAKYRPLTSLTRLAISQRSGNDFVIFLFDYRLKQPSEEQYPVALQCSSLALIP
jgi:hypothetical protein